MQNVMFQGACFFKHAADDDGPNDDDDDDDDAAPATFWVGAPNMASPGSCMAEGATAGGMG